MKAPGYHIHSGFLHTTMALKNSGAGVMAHHYQKMTLCGKKDNQMMNNPLWGSYG